MGLGGSRSLTMPVPVPQHRLDRTRSWGSPDPGPQDHRNGDLNDVWTLGTLESAGLGFSLARADPDLRVRVADPPVHHDLKGSERASLSRTAGHLLIWSQPAPSPRTAASPSGAGVLDLLLSRRKAESPAFRCCGCKATIYRQCRRSARWGWIPPSIPHIQALQVEG